MRNYDRLAKKDKKEFVISAGTMVLSAASATKSELSCSFDRTVCSDSTMT